MLRFTADYREVVTLNDGREVLLRLVRPDDKPLLLAGFAKLSATGRLRRFLVTKKELSKAELR